METDLKQNAPTKQSNVQLWSWMPAFVALFNSIVAVYRIRDDTWTVVLIVTANVALSLFWTIHAHQKASSESISRPTADLSVTETLLPRKSVWKSPLCWALVSAAGIIGLPKSEASTRDVALTAYVVALYVVFVLSNTITLFSVKFPTAVAGCRWLGWSVVVSAAVAITLGVYVALMATV